MSFDPDKFFVGLIDFFSILLPGALITWFTKDFLGAAVLADKGFAQLGSAQAWGVFLFASYLFGHLVFLLGSWLDELFDWARRHTLNKQISRLARRGQLLPWPVRALIWLVFKRERDLAVERARKIKEAMLAPLNAQDAINTFQWGKALLTLESRESLAIVQRFEADSKFFRSLTVVLIFVLVAWPWQHKWPIIGFPMALALFVISIWRYMEQRLKATNQVYWSVIALAARDEKFAPAKMVAKPKPSHAGGVVFRGRGGAAKYLLVEAKNDHEQWVLPKGHIEQGESPGEAAVREVLEETGVWARIVRDLRITSWSVDGQAIETRFFLMEAKGRGLRADRDRDREKKWLSLQEAVKKVKHEETRKLLKDADQVRL